MRPHFRRLLLPVLIVFSFHSAQNNVIADGLYQVTYMGNYVQPIVGGLNNAGQMVGQADERIPSSPAVIYNAYGPNAGLSLLPGAQNFAPSAINDAGQVAGTSGYAIGLYRAAVDTAGQLAILPLPAGWDSSHATAINAQGQVIGNGLVGKLDSGFFFDGHQSVVIPALPGFQSSPPEAINAFGQVVGPSIANVNGTFMSRAFLYDQAGIHDLGTLGGSQSAAIAINNAGQIVGSAQTASGTTHAFLFVNGSMKDLGALPAPPGDSYSQANSINNAGVAVGESNSYHGYRAVVFENGLVLDLNSLIPPGLGWTLYDAGPINDLGQISALGEDGAGHYAEFLLTPDNLPAPAPIPEPTPWVLFGPIAGLCAWRRLRIRRASPSGLRLLKHVCE